MDIFWNHPLDSLSLPQLATATKCGDLNLVSRWPPTKHRNNITKPPTMEGIGNSKGVGGSKTQEIPEARGVGQSNHFPGGQYHFVFDLSSNITSYRPGRSFLGHE